MTDSLDMGKHRVKNGHTHPKNGHSHKPRSDPSNDEYITVLQKVSLDSLVEFSPHELNSCRYVGVLVDRPEFDPGRHVLE